MLVENRTINLCDGRTAEIWVERHATVSKAYLFVTGMKICRTWVFKIHGKAIEKGDALIAKYEKEKQENGGQDG